MSIDVDHRARALRAWARGLLPLEAAVELLITALDGRLLDGPWIRKDEQGRVWFDPDVAAAEDGHLSGGERRILAVATSLAGEEHPVDLGDAITGLDHDELRLVLWAAAHAGGLEPDPRPKPPVFARAHAKRRRAHQPPDADATSAPAPGGDENHTDEEN
ncbi:hypothetical protein [Rothia halotolerans]|uniref:hypothetical protein n=1 Tax=Rothia halotolerans TaxID=405770 RepID=UPI00101BD635|nr:hypothetical protein [Rothia halotolerans]